MAASVWMNDTQPLPGRERRVALTTPTVTVLSKPKGEPMASTHSPTLVGCDPCFHLGCEPGFKAIDESRWGQLSHRQLAGVDLQQSHVGQLVAAQHLGTKFSAVAQPDQDLVGIGHHMRVGQDQAIGANDEARTFAAHLQLQLRRQPTCDP